MTSASRPNSSSAPCSRRMLPTDFAIFSAPISTMPLCIQIRASGRPRAASVWAISFSWWGNTRSEPPPWISKSRPRICSAIAEHSMCQPGRPSPHGRLPPAVLALLARLPEREVLRRPLELGRVVALALLHLLERAVRELAVVRVAAHAEVHVAACLVGVAGLHEVGDQVHDRADRLRGLRLRVRAPQPQAVGVLHVGGGHLRRQRRALDPALARGVVDLVVHVGDVLDQRHVQPLVLEEALVEREDHERARVAHVDAAVDRRPAGVDAHLAGLDAARAAPAAP